MPKVGFKVLFRIFGSIALFLMLSFFGFAFYLQADRPLNPAPSDGFVVPFQILGASVYVTEAEREISEGFFFGAFGFSALAFIASRRRLEH